MFKIQRKPSMTPATDPDAFAFAAVPVLPGVPLARRAAPAPPAPAIQLPAPAPAAAPAEVTLPAQPVAVAGRTPSLAPQVAPPAPTPSPAAAAPVAAPVRQGPPPGWYMDPSGRPGQRYWDGTAWTQHTA